MSCMQCGYEPVPLDPAQCPLCKGEWETWELMWPALPLPKNREQIAAWISQLPYPIAVDINVRGGDGMRVRLHAPPKSIDGAMAAWAAMNHQQTNFVKSDQSVCGRQWNRFGSAQPFHFAEPGNRLHPPLIRCWPLEASCYPVCPTQRKPVCGYG